MQLYSLPVRALAQDFPHCSHSGLCVISHGALARVCPFPTRLEAFDGCVLGTIYEHPNTAGSTRPISESCGTMPRLELVLKEGFISLVEERVSLK